MRFWGTRTEWRDVGLYLRRAILDGLIWLALCAAELAALPKATPAVIVGAFIFANIPLAIYVIRPRVQRWLGWE